MHLEQPDPRQDRRGFDNRRVEVEYLVNNAGYGLFGNAIERTAPSNSVSSRQHPGADDLSLRFADQLIRHRGGISMSGRSRAFCRGGHAVYYASKPIAVVQRRAAAELRAEGRPRDRDLPRPVPSNFRRGRVSARIDSADPQ